ncbi:DNA mismatch repair protein MutS [Desulfovibrio sulfodismutans]|uniref:DNA mismatch repair protein MutS n=1 Tax=Desulfolutivibrio sulfodismutans TaxID=63561 RepID=A0A7K3NNC9_9BACT|nr:Smr/MutS family protein [Desulfolutivibrio sulfodismutans]NDY57702.1 DNA mismatch repair protein MutS [Desulfolutivibrio sulfodismutans]QLA10904.1 DNA mismatch repair protein MutS [Desulfolutivibrio sulfodismutans DSM 3696]
MAEQKRAGLDALKSLKIQKKKPEPVKAPPKPAPDPDIPADDEEHLFSQAMSGVRAMDGTVRGRVVVPKPADPRPGSMPESDPDGKNALLDLVAGRVEFELSFTDEYLQGFVRDMDQKVFRQLRAGQFSPEAHLDMHGQNAAQAQLALLHFVRENYLAGKRCLLLIPGRGANSPGGLPVLKEELKTWLTRDPLKRVILAFATALPRHGGAGALYVLLRKFKKTKGKVRWENFWDDLG